MGDSNSDITIKTYLIAGNSLTRQSAAKPILGKFNDYRKTINMIESSRVGYLYPKR